MIETNEECLMRRWTDEKAETSRLRASLARYEDKIREQGDTIERMARSGVDNARRFAADIAAERGIIARLRAAIFAGATDVAQRAALDLCLEVVDGHEPWWAGSDVRHICAALLACNEALREARAEIARMREAAREMAEP